jgi:hypothetical protein
VPRPETALATGWTIPRKATGCGFKARHPDELRGAIAKALAVDGPAIVDCVVADDEMPNVPRGTAADPVHAVQRSALLYKALVEASLHNVHISAERRTWGAIHCEDR